MEYKQSPMKKRRGKPAPPLLPNEVYFTLQYICFGSSIKKYFIKNNINKLIIYLDFIDDNIIFVDGKHEGYPIKKNRDNVSQILFTMTKYLEEEHEKGKPKKYKLEKINSGTFIIRNPKLINLVRGTANGIYTLVNVKDGYIVAGASSDRYIYVDIPKLMAKESITGSPPHEDSKNKSIYKENEENLNKNNSSSIEADRVAIDKVDKEYSKMILGE